MLMTYEMYHVYKSVFINIVYESNTYVFIYFLIWLHLHTQTIEML